MRRIFFAFPYGYDREAPFFRPALREVCEAQGFETVIADERFNPSHLLSHINALIDECDAGVFDITGFNPNVLIEFGVSFGSEKPSFLIINPERHHQKLLDFWQIVKPSEIAMPADLAGLQRIEYRTKDDLVSRLGEALRQKFGPSPPDPRRVQEQIKDLLKEKPLQMGQIALATGMDLNEVRAMLYGLRMRGDIVRVSGLRGTLYRLT